MNNLKQRQIKMYEFSLWQKNAYPRIIQNISPLMFE